MKNLTKILVAIYVVIMMIAVACKKDEPMPTQPVTTPTTTPPAVTKSTAKDLTKFSFAALSPVVDATIDASTKAITATVPAGTDLTKLVPTITISDKSTISPAMGVAQDFSKEVSYTVTAEDASTVVYKVNVKKEAVSSAVFSTDQLVYTRKSVKISDYTYAEYIVAQDAITGKELGVWDMGENTKSGGNFTYRPSSLGNGSQCSVIFYDNNSLYTGNEKDYYTLEARDAISGKIKWTKDMKSITTTTGVYGAESNDMVVDNGLIFYAKGVTIVALEPTTGNEKWKITLNVSLGIGGITVSNGVLYASTDVGILAFDATTGNEKWKINTLNRISSNPAVANGTVYFAGFDSKKVYAVDALTGKIKWESPIAGYGIVSPTVSDGIVYMACYCGTLYAIEEATGTLKWQQKLGGTYLQSPLTDANNVYQSDYESGKIFVLDKKTGTKIREITTSGIGYDIVLANSLLYTTREVFDTQTGTKKWEVPKNGTTNLGYTDYGRISFVILEGKYYGRGNSGMQQ